MLLHFLQEDPELLPTLECSDIQLRSEEHPSCQLSVFSWVCFGQASLVLGTILSLPLTCLLEIFSGKDDRAVVLLFENGLLLPFLL